MLIVLVAPLAFLLFNVFSLSVLMVLARAWQWLRVPAYPPGTAPTISRRMVKISLIWQLGLLVPLALMNLNRAIVLLVLAITSFVVPLTLLLLAHRRSPR